MKTIRILALSLVLASVGTSASFAEGFELKEEAYINDIPFDTHRIAAEYSQQKAISIRFEPVEENPVADIPFDTEQVAETERSNRAMQHVFRPAPEAFIHDIPFSTTSVACSVLCTEALVNQGSTNRTRTL